MLFFVVSCVSLLFVEYVWIVRREPITQDLLDSIFYLYESRVLGCDAHIICIYKAPFSIIDVLIVCTYFERGRGDNISL